MQNNGKFLYSFFGGPTYGEGGVRWLGQMPNFFQKNILRAPLSDHSFVGHHCDFDGHGDNKDGPDVGDNHVGEQQELE